MKVILNCENLLRREQAHEYLAQMLQFPTYYGKNLDALYDCLTDLHDCEITLKGAAFLTPGSYGERIVKTLQDAAQANPTLVLNGQEQNDGTISEGQMSFRMCHENYNVADLDRSLKFYEQALGLTEQRRNAAQDGSYIIVYIGNPQSDFQLELTWLRDHPQPYDLGECEFHLAFETDDYESAHEKHRQMGCICFENPKMGIYFIEDPDGYWLEILPKRD